MALGEVSEPRWTASTPGSGETPTCLESGGWKRWGGLRGPCAPLGSGSCPLSRVGWRQEAGQGGGCCPAEMGPHTSPTLPTGSGGLTPSPPACGPCCWGCTWPGSTCRLPHPAGWTRSSSAPCPCAAWWASQQPWPRGRQQAHGGSGPEGQRSSNDCGGRTDGQTAPELGPRPQQGPSLLCVFLPCLAPAPTQCGASRPGPALYLPEEAGLPLPFPFHTTKSPQPEALPQRPIAAHHCHHLLAKNPSLP